MSYTTIILIDDAKTYLGLDDDSRDAEVTRMIKASLKYVEKETNHIFQAQDKDYVFVSDCIRVYDFPINTDDNTTQAKKPLYSTFTGTSGATLALNVGYSDISKIPEDLVEATYGVLKFFFFEQEKGGEMPSWINHILDLHRRFII